MSKFARALSQLLGPKPGPVGRMTEQAVQALAAAAAVEQGVSDHVAVMRTRSLERRVVWDAGTLTKDGGWSCTIDDESGRVIASGHNTDWGKQFTPG